MAKIWLKCGWTVVKIWVKNGWNMIKIWVKYGWSITECLFCCMCWCYKSNKVNFNGNAVCSKRLEFMAKAVRVLKINIKIFLFCSRRLWTAVLSPPLQHKTLQSEEKERERAKWVRRVCVLTVKGCLLGAHPSDGVEQTVSPQWWSAS